MPVSTKRQTRTEQPLRTPQARVLAALMPIYPDDPVSEWPSMTTYRLAVVIGTSTKSDYIRRALRGLPEGASSGSAHDGLLAKMLVESFEVDIDGTIETYYRITSLGIRTIQRYLTDHKLQQTRSADTCTNKRYRKLQPPC